jgi:SWI/SNF related-matrix-associated actin-dependent regulator of chromatin subfamily C
MDTSEGNSQKQPKDGVDLEKEKEAAETATESSSNKERAETAEALQVAAATALGAAATKAKYLAGIEERRMKSLVAQLVESQMKKVFMSNICFTTVQSFFSWS